MMIGLNTCCATPGTRRVELLLLGDSHDAYAPKQSQTKPQPPLHALPFEDVEALQGLIG
jgi:hypothetical protein